MILVMAVRESTPDAANNVLKMIYRLSYISQFKTHPIWLMSLVTQWSQSSHCKWISQNINICKLIWAALCLAALKSPMFPLLALRCSWARQSGLYVDKQCLHCYSATPYYIPCHNIRIELQQWHGWLSPEILMPITLCLHW